MVRRLKKNETRIDIKPDHRRIKGVDDTFDWIAYFNQVFEDAKAWFRKVYPFEDEGEVSPDIVALRDAIFHLPIPIKILELKVDTLKYPDIKDEICHLIKYDFTKFGVSSVEYLGIIDTSNSKKLAEILARDFKGEAEKLAEDFCRELRIIGFGPDNLDIYYQFLRYNIKENFGRYSEDFAMLFLSQAGPGFQASQKFKKIIDYNTLYNLKPDPILSLSEILEKVEKRTWPKASIEERQKHVANIQLIPPVPEDVRRVFKIAKDLYIYGCFEYLFFTVSQHYAYLALESAIKHRYAKSLSSKAVIVNKEGEKHIIENPTYERIWKFCKDNKKRWNFNRITINDESFPYNGKLLLKWLVEKGIITKWEQQFYDASLFLRNTLSHLEFASIHTPNCRALERVAEQINKLYVS